MTRIKLEQIGSAGAYSEPMGRRPDGDANDRDVLRHNEPAPCPPRDRTFCSQADRLEQSPDGKLRARRRYRGQSKRGAMPRIEADVLGVRRAIRELSASLKQLEHVRADRAMTDIERREAHRTALGRTCLAERMLGEILDRPQPK